ncbi:Glucocorticoid-induced transcript 1 protein, partial [Operophtera brumata]
LRFSSGSVPLRAARSSVEGLNQEIERLVLYPASGTQTPHLDRLRDKFSSGSVPLRAARSSVEGLNQEIERLVLYPASGTQTPHHDRLRDKRHSNTTPRPAKRQGNSSFSGSVPLRAARSSVEGLNQEIERLVLYPASGTQTPHHDRLRDKVNLRAGEGAYTEPLLMKPAVSTFTLRPSLGSAFHPLQPSPPPRSPPATHSLSHNTH